MARPIAGAEGVDETQRHLGSTGQRRAAGVKNDKKIGVEGAKERAHPVKG